MVEWLITSVACASSNGSASAVRTTQRSWVSASCTWQTTGTPASRPARSHQGSVTVLT